MKKKILLASLFLFAVLAVTLIVRRNAIKGYFSQENMAASNIQAGMHALSVGDAEKAVRNLDAAVNLDPKNPLAPYYLARAYKLRGDPVQRQILAYQKAIELDPTFTEARISLGAVFYEEGKSAEAEK